MQHSRPFRTAAVLGALLLVACTDSGDGPDDFTETDPTVQNDLATNAALDSSRCEDGQVVKLDDGAWTCAADAGITEEADPTIQNDLATNAALHSSQCDDGQVVKVDDGAWTCASDDGLTEETDPSVENDLASVAALDSSQCDDGQVVKLAGGAWTCAADEAGVTTEVDPTLENDLATASALQATNCPEGATLQVAGGTWACRCRPGQVVEQGACATTDAYLWGDSISDQTIDDNDSSSTPPTVCLAYDITPDTSPFITEDDGLDTSECGSVGTRPTTAVYWPPVAGTYYIEACARATAAFEASRAELYLVQRTATETQSLFTTVGDVDLEQDHTQMACTGYTGFLPDDEAIGVNAAIADGHVTIVPTSFKVRLLAR